MQEFFVFLMDQWFLSLSFLAVLLMLIWSYMAPSVQGFKELRPNDAIKKMNGENSVVLDVRSENEFLNGHIINSINVPAAYISKRMEELEKYKEGEVLVVCKSGARSKAACVELRKAGFENVSGLAGGILAWQHDKLPLAKK